MFHESHRLEKRFTCTHTLPLEFQKTEPGRPGGRVPGTVCAAGCLAGVWGPATTPEQTRGGLPSSSSSVGDKVHERHGERPFAAGVPVDVADLKQRTAQGVIKMPMAEAREGPGALGRGRGTAPAGASPETEPRG